MESRHVLGILFRFLLLATANFVAVAPAAAEDNTTTVISGTVIDSPGTGSYVVGLTGTNNSLEINGGGMLMNFTGMIGANAGARNNLVRITDSGSVWSNRGDLYVGHYGSENSMRITNGGTVFNYYGKVGYWAGANNNSVTVTGSGSVWSNYVSLYLGTYGSGNSLKMTDGGRVFNTGGYLGYWPESSGNSVMVTGSGSVWSNAFDLRVGMEGPGNSLTIASSGLVVNPTGFIGFNPSASNNSVTVTDSGSVWSNGSTLYIGLTSFGNRLTVSNGGQVFSTSGCFGETVNASNNSVTVTGAASMWRNSSDISVGSSGSGNSLTIAESSRVSNAFCFIGNNASASNNSVMVMGSGTVWSNAFDLYVGNSGSYNQLGITSAAIVSGRSACVGRSAGAVGNVLWLSNGTLAVGSLTISNGNTVSGLGTIAGALNNNGSVSADGGTLTVLGDVVNRGTLQAINGGVAEFFGDVVNSGATNFSGGSAIFHGAFVATRGATNAWVDKDSGQWREDGRWSLGVAPNDAQSVLLITNANSKTVTVDAMTSGVTNWASVVSAPAGSTNMLRVERSGWRMANILVEAGGRLLVTNAAIGVGLAGQGKLRVEGGVAVSGGTLDASTVSAVLGSNGTAQISLEDGVLVTRDCRLGGATGSVLEATGRGLWWQLGTLIVGTNTAGNQLVVSGGLQLTSTNGYVGYTAGSSNNSVLVTGSGSAWRNASLFYVGASGAGNCLTISNGALVRNTSGALGSSSGGSNNSVLVTGSGSVWSNAVNLYVGSGGPSNSLTISDGGLVTASNVWVGSTPSSPKNVLTVWNGTLNVANVLDVRRGSMSVSTGTVVAVGIVATNGTSAAINFGGGTIAVRQSTISNGAPFRIGDGVQPATLRLSGGTNSCLNGWLVSDNGVVAGSGVLAGRVVVDGTLNPSGVLGINGMYTQNMGGRFQVGIADRNSVDRLDVSGPAVLAGTLTVVTNGYAPRSGESFNLLSAEALAGTFGAIELPAIWPGLRWDVQYNNPVGCVTLTATGRATLASYDIWADYHQVAGGALDDPGGNGVPNLSRYAMGIAPTGFAKAATCKAALGSGWPQIVFPRNVDATDVDYIVEASYDLTQNGWSCILSNLHATGWAGPAGVVETPVTAGQVEVTVTDLASDVPRRFLRLRICRP